MIDYLSQANDEFQKPIDFFHTEISTIRSGRAHPGILDNITVSAYGVKTPIAQLATINVPDARSLTIQPWDRGVLSEIEKAIREANIGINPVNEGTLIRLVVPQLTEETRKNLVKVLNQKLENARISIRQVRDKVKEEINKAEKDKEITEDNKFALLKKLDEKTTEYNNKVKEIGEKKEVEIMTI
jgi:ribosome recycling factor